MKATLRDCIVSSNNPGLQSNGAVAKIHCSRVTIVGNGSYGGILAANGGKFGTFGNNDVEANGGGAAGNSFPAGSSLAQE